MWMYQRLIIGNKIIKLVDLDSTNTYLQQLISNNEKDIEGLVVVAENQNKGRGQRGNDWNSEEGKNLTFSILLKSKLLVQHQFLLSKVISLGILDFLNKLGIVNATIKWPNDVYIDKNKVAGILIENTIRENKIYNSIVGIGLNVNQINFNNKIKNPTSLIKELQGDILDLEELLGQLLFFIEKRYLLLKTNKTSVINADYLKGLYGLGEYKNFNINNTVVEAKIVGVSELGRFQLEINNRVEEFDLKEVEFLF
jgi:BirA family transcriptional regulator, biotin operon repressor / biotin---[acetyl-CoA-carboxylase] ligase